MSAYSLANMTEITLLPPWRLGELVEWSINVLRLRDQYEEAAGSKISQETRGAKFLQKLSVMAQKYELKSKWSGLKFSEDQRELFRSELQELLAEFGSPTAAIATKPQK
ncbi:MAG: hypothetical protein AB1540_06605 [Bdellovibrionota bacterium]